MMQSYTLPNLDSQVNLTYAYERITQKVGQYKKELEVAAVQPQLF